MHAKYLVILLVLVGLGFSVSLTADVVDPVGDVEINQYRMFNVTVNVSCSGGNCGSVNVSLHNYQSSCKEILDAGHSTGDGVYTIYPSGHPEGVDVYCDMTTDGGGWTLVFAGMGETSTYSSTWAGWFTEGYTTDLEDKSTEGKSVAYDSVPVATIMLESTYGTDGVIIADLDQTYDSLLELIEPDPGCNDGGSDWNQGLRGPFYANYPHTGDHFVNDWIRIWVGDQSEDCEDRVVFATQFGDHGDWSGENNPGAIGGEYRTARYGYDWYYVWVRGPGLPIPPSQLISLSNGQSQLVTFTINASSVGGGTYYAYAEQVSNSSVNDTSDEFMVFVYPQPQVEFLSPPTYVSSNDVTVNIDTSYFLEGLDSVWWNNGTDNITYTGEVTEYFPDGIYTFTAYANDTTGYLASSTIQVNVKMCGIEVDSDYTLTADLDCREYDGNVIIVTDNDVTIDCDGHSILGSGRDYFGIYSSFVTGTVVKNCYISGFDDGIYFYYTDEGEIIDNTLVDNEDGVYLEYSDNNVLHYNNFSSNDYGFYLYYADNNQIGHNYVDLTRYSNFGGSCPFLYLWNGEEYEYYTDLASEVIGREKYEVELYEAGIYELGDFKSEDGTYKMKIREVIPESDYVDEVKLVLVDVPEGYGVLNQWHNTYSDQESPPKEFMTIKDPKVPISAIDKHGNDVLAEVSGRDGIPLPMEFDDANSVVVDFGQIDNPQYAKLIITGWSAYGTEIQEPTQPNLLIETMNEYGEWEEAKLFGKFTGDSRTFVFDIAGILEQNDTRMRITAAYSETNAKIIDQILLDDSEPVDIEVTYVDPSIAELYWGGSTTLEYSTIEHRITATDEQLPNDAVSLMYGNYTKYGDVRPLLEETDDMFAIMRHGDLLELEFGDIAPVEGKDRYAFLKADVMYSIKYSGGGRFISDSISLMPFHGMSQYPYDTSEENYPYDQTHIDYINEWNTRNYEKPVKYGGSLPWSFNNTVFENVLIGDSGDFGIGLDNEEFTSILNNNISDFEIGISIYASDDSIVSGNRITGAEVGIDLYESDYNEISENFMDTAEGRGMIIRADSEDNYIWGNTIISDSSSDCDFGGAGCGGIFVGYSYVNIIEDNSVTSIDGKGIAVLAAENNEIIGNTFDLSENDDEDYAIYVDESPNYEECGDSNLFVRNTIISDYWVHDDCGDNYYSDDYSGNAYYFADGTPSWEVYDYFGMVDLTEPPDGWADDADEGLPFNHDLPDEQWDGDGDDYHPAIVETPSVHMVEVELISPPDGVSIPSPVIFRYIPTVGWEGQVLDYCNLSVWNMAFDYFYNSSDSVTEGEQNTFTMTLPLDEYQWSIECTDEMEIFGESETRSLNIVPQGQDNDGPSDQQEKLSLGLEASCEENVLTVTTGGDAVKNAEINVYEEATFASVDSGQTDENGEFAFDACGMDVRIYAKKNGYTPVTDVFALDGCTCVEEEPQPVLECSVDADCPSDETCEQNSCVPIACECGYVSDRTCVAYECCADADCSENEICTDNACVAQAPEQECLSDSDCAEDEECKDGTCTAKPPAEDEGAADALDRIQEAQDAIDAAKAAGKDTSEAESLLKLAQDAYNQNDYEEASSLAEQAKDAAEAAGPVSEAEEEQPAVAEEKPSDALPALLFLALLGIIILGAAAYLFMGKSKK